ncbi:ABC transporter permease [Devosia sp.]|uniref:ABC transporter permease n=1 Tax=Devosia sp. TaxID=1871048 RepID=UPI002AFF0118|nr:ABC transporter permease [Devosia sp.]
MVEASNTLPVRRQRRPLPPTLVIGLLLVGLVLAMALVSLVWTPYDPARLNVRARLTPPGSEGFLLGTDKLGRDVLTQIMVGAQNTLFVSVVSSLLSLLIGVALGLAAAAARPRLRNVINRGIDIAAAIPGILVAMVLATTLSPGNTAAIIAIVAWFTPSTARVTLGPAQQALAQDYVEAAQAYGRSKGFIMFRHVLPNIAPVLIVQTSVMFASAILVEATLSFIGVGAQPPVASWGRILRDAQPLIDVAPSLMLYPGLAIIIAVLGFNLLGDGLRGWLDPKQGGHGTGGQ